MQNVAQAWLVYRLTQSSFMLGLVAFCGLFPVLLFSLVGGVVADRVNRHRLLILAHSLGLLQALVLAVITLGGWVQPWHIIVLSSILGVLHAFEMPARHSFIADMVPREDLPNAIALNSSAFNIARFMGPFMAGVFVGWWQEGPVFLINAVSFTAVLTGLLCMHVKPRDKTASTGSALSHIREGLSFAWHQPMIRAGLMILSMFSIVGTSMTVLMPVFAHQVFFGQSEVLGMLLGSMGIGALTGAFILAYRSTYHHLQVQIAAAGVVAGICLMLFPWMRVLLTAMPLLAIFGFCQTILAASINTLIQSLAPDQMRGRVMSIFSMVFIGLMPIGSLVSGYTAEKIGVDHTVLILGQICLLVSIIFMIYVTRKSIAAQK